MDNDPFFATGPDIEWNACIGPQSDEENYADGYIEAAVELADAIFEKALYEKRDTLVLPILYNARHAIELALKKSIGELVNMGVLERGLPKDHNILKHWKHLATSQLGDESLKELVVEIEPYVVSLTQIDGDGQEFRYHETRAGVQSLKDYPITSLVLVRQSLAALHDVLIRLKNKLRELRYERSGGFFTAELSRRDLVHIAERLPKRSNWGSKEFDLLKADVKTRYNIGSRKFSTALDLIQGNRETRGLIGIESELLYLSDDKSRLLVEKHNELYPPTHLGSGWRITSMADWDVEAFLRDRELHGKILQDLFGRLSADEIADLRVIFYLGRNLELPETYETRMQEETRRIGRSDGLFAEFTHVFTKTNFRSKFVSGLHTLGKVTLADALGRFASD